MANEIKWIAASGQILYSIVLSPGGSGWNGAGLIPVSNGLWPGGALAMTGGASGLGIYFGNFPVGITQPGVYPCLVYHQLGVSPAITDTYLGQTSVSWNSHAALGYPMALEDYTAPNNVAIDDMQAIVDNFTFNASGYVNMVLPQAAEDALANELLDLTNSIENGESLRQTLRLLRAVLAGEATVSGSSVNFIRKDGSTVAVTVVHDAIGNRTSSTDGNLN